ncbi:unnamed protein product [Prorocentrum cordatum]|uniref:Thioredoxin domain-containing protein n=1 Tax=Prorocentrum cordatum TaxID=2364126 RepID=A0ABN9TIH7_9DINO|nr:unnamed protein product [Polarella glacialis]
MGGKRGRGGGHPRELAAAALRRLPSPPASRSALLAALLLASSAPARCRAAGPRLHAGRPTNCTRPALAVGPLINSSAELNRALKRHKRLLVGFSAASCTTCCTQEPLYEEALPLLPKGVHWVRVDMDRLEAKALATTYEIESLPAVVFLRRERGVKAVRLVEAQRPQVLAAFVSKVLAPVQLIFSGGPMSDGTFHGAWPTAEDDLFGGLRSRTARHLVRVAALFDGEPEEEDAEELAAAAEAFAGRPLSFSFARTADRGARLHVSQHPLVAAACGSLAASGRALVAMSLLDGEYVDGVRLKPGGDLAGFPVAAPASSSRGLVLNVSASGGGGMRASVPPRVTCRAFDSYDGQSVEQWVLHAILPPVGRFDPITSPLYEKTQKPLLMLFVDTSRPELPALLQLLQAAHERYNADNLRVIFLYINGVAFLHRMTSLGLTADPKRLPALAFNFVTAQLLTWQPPAEQYADGSARLTADVLNSLVQRYLSGSNERASEADAPKAVPVPKRKPGTKRDVPSLDTLSLQQRLRFVTAVNGEGFSEVVLDSSRDVAVFFFASSGKAAEASEKVAIYVNRCAERFEELKVRTIRVVRFDMSLFAAPPSVQVSEVPSMVFFPAFSKEPPYQVFRGKWKVQQLMWWIQDRASLGFSLPELPHLDEQEAALYWEQKEGLDEVRQRRVASENEGSKRQRLEL